MAEPFDEAPDCTPRRSMQSPTPSDRIRTRGSHLGRLDDVLERVPTSIINELPEGTYSTRPRVPRYRPITFGSWSSSWPVPV